MKITLTIDVPGGAEVAQEERAQIRYYADAAIRRFTVRGKETDAVPLFDWSGQQFGTVSCTAQYSDAPPPRPNHGVLHPTREDRAAFDAVESP